VHGYINLKQSSIIRNSFLVLVKSLGKLHYYNYFSFWELKKFSLRRGVWLCIKKPSRVAFVSMMGAGRSISL